MPVYRFWLMNAQIDRIRAESDLRAARVARYVQGDVKAMQELSESLQQEMGQPISVVNVDEVETDRDQHERMKILAQG